MQIVKTATGYSLKLTQAEWENIGQENGWVTTAAAPGTMEDLKSRLASVYKVLNNNIDFIENARGLVSGGDMNLGGKVDTIRREMATLMESLSLLEDEINRSAQPLVQPGMQRR